MGIPDSSHKKRRQQQTVNNQHNSTSGHPNPSVWWKHRRRMAYVSVIWSILQTIMWIGIELIAPGTVSSLSAVIGWSYGSVSTIILGYFGNTAVDTYRNRRSHSEPSSY